VFEGLVVLCLSVFVDFVLDGSCKVIRSFFKVVNWYISIPIESFLK